MFKTKIMAGFKPGRSKPMQIVYFGLFMKIMNKKFKFSQQPDKVYMPIKLELHNLLHS